MIRDVLLGVYALAWLIVMIITVWRKGEIDPLLWAALGGGVGVIMGIFRAEDTSTKKNPTPDKEKASD